jgi:hypothetical protein
MSKRNAGLHWLSQFPVIAAVALFINLELAYCPTKCADTLQVRKNAGRLSVETAIQG